MSQSRASSIVPVQQAWIVLLIIAFVGFICAYQYIQTIGVQCEHHCAEMYQDTRAGTIDSPYRYRILPAWLIAPLVGDGSPPSVTLAYGLAHVVALPAMFLVLFAWLRVWLDETRALAGVLVVAALFPIMVQVWGIALYTPIEVICLCVGLLLLRTQPRGWTPLFALVIVVGTLNRETAVLLPLAYAVTQVDHRRRAGYGWRLALFGATWAGVYAALRLSLGAAPDSVTVAETWTLNTGGGWHMVMAVLKHALFVPLWIAYAVHVRTAPPFLKRLLLVIIVYLALFAVFALWHEVRLLLPVLVLSLPVILQPTTPDVSG